MRLAQLCQTAREALVLARAGVSDLLVANEVVDPDSLSSLMEAAQLTRVTVAVDSAAHVQALAEVARGRRSTIGVVVELDVGGHRCGVDVDGEELPQLVDQVTTTSGLDFVGASRL